MNNTVQKRSSLMHTKDGINSKLLTGDKFSLPKRADSELKVAITPKDLEAIRKVLQKKRSLVEVGTEYSVRHKTLVAHTILRGANVQSQDLEQRGMYGLLLWYLVVVPAMPPRGYIEGSEGPYPKWRTQVHHGLLVARSREYRLHAPADRTGTVNRMEVIPVITELLAEDPEFPVRCREWYEEALANIRRYEQ